MPFWPSLLLDPTSSFVGSGIAEMEMKDIQKHKKTPKVKQDFIEQKLL
jgi:hypothetical protein